ncbi:MAG: YihY/virulence factor BrkB family protein [bacterium]
MTNRLENAVERARAWLLRYQLIRAILLAGERYEMDGCVYMAAALSFYGILSMIPLTFVGLWALTALAGSYSIAQSQLEGFLRNYLLPDVARDLMLRIRGIADAGALSILGTWWGGLAFIWSGISFYEFLQSTLSKAWGGQSARQFLHRKLFTLVAFLIAGILMGLTMFLTAATTTLESISLRILGDSLSDFWVGVVHGLPFVLSIAVFFLLYKFMPRVFVPWRLALGAAVPVAVLWEIGKRIFTVYVTSSHRYTSLYGPMASLVVLMVWIYYSSSLVLFGAEVGAAWQNESKGSTGGHAAR